MRGKLLILSVLAFVMTAVSCEIPFALDKVSDPAIYLQYLPSSELEARMMVAYADPAFGKPGKVKYEFSPSDVRLEINDKRITLTDVSDEDALNAHELALPEGTRFNPGDRVSVTVSGRGGVPDATASTVVPVRPVIKSVDFKQVTRDSSDAWRVLIQLDKPVKEGEYYGIKAARRTELVTASGPDLFHLQLDTMVNTSYFTPGQVASTSDLNNLDLDAFASVVYQDGFMSVDMFSSQPLTLLAPKQFDGDTYSFYINADGLIWDEFDFGFLFEGEDDQEWLDGMATASGEGEYDGDDGDDPDSGDPWDDGEDGIWMVVSEKSEYRFEMYRLSDEFYNYAKAQYLANFNMLSNFGVSPPNFTYTNVLGGIGIVAGISGDATQWLTTPKWVKQDEDK